MIEKDQQTAEKRYIAETAISLSSGKEEQVIAKLNQLKSIGKASILPYILDLLNTSSSDRVKQEVISFISILKDKNCVPPIVKFIGENSDSNYIHQIISACWQTQLNFSSHMNSFISFFISGDYQTALESFTVIEEMLWQTDDNSISEAKKILEESVSKISDNKKPLFNELLKVLNEGRSKSYDEYTDLIE